MHRVSNIQGPRLLPPAFWTINLTSTGHSFRIVCPGTLFGGHKWSRGTMGGSPGPDPLRRLPPPSPPLPPQARRHLPPTSALVGYRGRQQSGRLSDQTNRGGYPVEAVKYGHTGCGSPPLAQAETQPNPTQPNPSLEIGWKVLDHGRQRRPKENLLELVEGEKMGFHPMCLYSKYSVFSGEPNNG